MARQYFGGTGITLEKMKEVLGDRFNVDGTTYTIDRWLAECAVFDALIPGKSKIWVPYGGAEFFGELIAVEWDKHEFKGYSYSTPETEDWWIAEPYLRVKHETEDNEYYVYEVTFYKNIRRKSQAAHLTRQQAKPKRKFLTKQDIIDFKRQEVISNAQNKRK